MSEKRFSPQVLRDREGEEGVAERLREWWARLHGVQGEGVSPYSSGARSVLRRATGPDDALLSEGFRYLWFALPQGRRTSRDMRAWGAVAIVLAEVAEHVPDRTFAAAMAAEREPAGSGSPVVSELRFRQLLQSRDLDEFVRRARRVVHLIDQRVDVRSLADDLLLWHREKSGYFAARPDHRLAVRWADAYFTRLACYPH
ncbi:type I-E CRISPR-associated protein Cse2/CasB [Ectothiorhodospira mobilis]|uniref:CRISPR-associated protein, Cse2 family n=1 Tax=Ectothiorhodospira mobilis TaxID=195064 RepID=A0A1I4SYN8_ECTMO|nr:type I-E CRISPR-associated protein Cse2/CasB [Ectothiorhodospira mobilis]MCG5536277.1 type I-E CRISPR-associated protein Cse2/CasB [Ectothiorhodospira mobilis]SFM69582.1 CRISPR-associated protein, Cse2 family [Ectothiorhodospira mobilis]